MHPRSAVAARTLSALALSLMTLQACAPDPAPLQQTDLDVHVDCVGTDDDPALDPGGPPGPASDAGVPTAQPVDSLFRELAFFQAVEMQVFANGYAVATDERNAPLIADRDAILRAMFDLPGAWAPDELTLAVDIVIDGETQTFTGSRDVQAASEDADPESGLVVAIAASAMVEGADYNVRLVHGETLLARFPETGHAELAAKETGSLKIHLVPFQVDGFTPDTSAVVVDGLRDAVMATYPVRDVVVSVGPVEVWVGEPNLGDINVAVGVLQEEEMFAGAASWDTYYYGMVTGAASRDDYSGITGTSEDGGQEELVRAYFAAGAAFGDQRSEDTLIHELGHIHGLEHTACDGEDDTDPDYPHADGSIGVEGYDFRSGTFVSSDSKSMMAYCYPRWVSDYNYAKIAEHVANAQGYAGYD
jgi:hypothetical protein